MRMVHICSILLSISLLVSVASCKGEHIPDGVVDTATFADFLTEAYLIEGYNYAVIRTNPDSLGQQLDQAYSFIYSKYNITPAVYDSSMNYYMEHPKLLEEVYARVVRRLQQHKDTIPQPAETDNSDGIEITLP